MKIDPKKLRILFVDDEELEVKNSLAREGYDVDYWKDVDSLDKLCDGKYQVIFLDIRGVGEKYGGSGLDILKYVASHNPLIYVAVFSAKPFTGDEAEIIRKFARRSITKDCTVYDIIEILEGYSASMTEAAVIQMLEGHVRLNWLAKWKIKRGQPLSPSQIEKIRKASALGADAVKIVANTTTIAAILIKIIHGVGP